MILIKPFVTEVSYDRYMLIYANLDEGNGIGECYSPLKLLIQAHLLLCCLLIKSLKFYSMLKNIYSVTSHIASKTLQKARQGFSVILPKFHLNFI